MESPIFFFIFAVTLLLTVAGFVLVVLHLLRQQARATSVLQQDLRTPFEQALEAVRSLAAEQQASLSAATERMLSMVLEEVQRSQLATMTSQESLTKEWTRGLSSLQSDTTRMLADAIALIGTKDPVAYQMVQGASSRPIYESSSQPGYTTADPEGLIQTVQEQDAASAFLQQLMNGGVPNVGPDAYAYGPFVGDDAAGEDSGSTSF